MLIAELSEWVLVSLNFLKKVIWEKSYFLRKVQKFEIS